MTHVCLDACAAQQEAEQAVTFNHHRHVPLIVRRDDNTPLHQTLAGYQLENSVPVLDRDGTGASTPAPNRLPDNQDLAL